MRIHPDDGVMCCSGGRLVSCEMSISYEGGNFRPYNRFSIQMEVDGGPHPRVILCNSEEFEAIKNFLLLYNAG